MDGKIQQALQQIHHLLERTAGSLIIRGELQLIFPDMIRNKIQKQKFSKFYYTSKISLCYNCQKQLYYAEKQRNITKFRPLYETARKNKAAYVD